MAPDIKRERFKKVAANRVQKIIDTLNLLSNCANKNNYTYSDNDVKAMFSEIDRVLKSTKDAFSVNAPKEDSRFRFED